MYIMYIITNRRGRIKRKYRWSVRMGGYKICIEERMGKEVRMEEKK